MEFLTTSEISEKWNISTRRITTLCNEGRIKGAVIKGNTWLIPDYAQKPECQKRGRKRAEKDDETNRV